MKFKLKRPYHYFIEGITILSLIVGIFLVVYTSTELKSMSEDIISSTGIVSVDSKVERSNKIDKYIENISEDTLIEEINIKNEVTSILINNGDKYESHLFNYETGEEIVIDDLLKSGTTTSFWDKIAELVYLKYPKFIADVISLNDKENVYFLKDNELVIYYYGYEIDPMPQEELYLRVNFNEIKDYLNISVDFDSAYENEDGSVINTNKKLIAITFDDGPGIYTDRLVSILNDNKVNATFFMLGSNLEKYRDTVLNVFNSGNEIAYHSYAHKNFLRQSIDEIQDEFSKSNEILKSITGTTFSLVRPPYGSIDSDVKNALDASFILWSVDTEDWRYKDTDYLLNYTLENIGEGDIVLFHDIHKTSVDVIEILLPYLYVQGYQVVTVSELASYFNVALESHTSYRNFTK